MMTEASAGRLALVAAQQLTVQSHAAVRSGDFETARQRARQAAAIFETGEEPQGLFEAAILLEKLNCVVEAARLMAIAGRLREPCRLTEWQGGSLDGQTLLVVQRIRDIGAPVRQARVIAQAVRLADRCIVFATPRLVPLFRRSFPAADVQPDSEASSAAWAESALIASYETLVWRLYRDDANLARSFSRLESDPHQTARLRTAYGGDARPRIGISWFSTNQAKDVPPVNEWARLMKQVDATFVSLQYGDVAADRAAMQIASGQHLIHDDSVDQLQNMDGFAAQVSAMDVVVTISNTLAQLAGALGVRTIVILDDKFHLIWPLRGEDSVWFPRTTLLHRKGRNWSVVFDQVREWLLDEFD